MGRYSVFIGFYSHQIHEIIIQHPSVFGETSEEDEGLSGEEGDENENKPVEGQVFNAYGYFCLIKRYSDCTHEQWKDIYGVNIHYFLNVCDFTIEQDRQTELYIKKLRSR